MKRVIVVLFFVTAFITGFAQNKLGHGKEFHVSVSGSDANDGSISKPLKTLMAAANAAMPGDVITVHAGVYREQITPPRGGNSGNERIVYQAAKGEKVEIKGSEIIKGWKKLDNDTWEVKISNSFFGKFNPYSDTIHGDWFVPLPKERKYLRGAVYLNGSWLMEAAKREEVLNKADTKNQLWSASVDADSTTIWAQFVNVDPNKELVEINVRETVFYPDKPFINYITVRGFTLEQAATNWAPPTAEQMGLIGTHWSRGWIIENNTVQYSKCAGIALGKYGDEFDNRNTESAEGYVGTIKRALAFGWNKGSIGGHIVRNNTIAYCEQVGVVGSMGCSFSTVQGNTIHDIYAHRLFGGAEMAGIKFHGAVDVQIKNNRIYGTDKAIWLDWMAQGAQITNNLLYENDLDIFLEVNHGPTLVANNLLLSKVNVLMNSSGAAFAHNLFAGAFNVYGYDPRLTPYHSPHSTYMVALHDNPSGDVQFVNNLFAMQGNAMRYNKALLPVTMSGNVYTMGTNQGDPKNNISWVRGVKDSIKALMKDKQAYGELDKQNFDAAARFIKDGDAFYLEISLDKNWLTEQKRQLVTTQTLKPAIVPNLPFENPDGSMLKMDADYLGNKRNTSNPSPGPFEILKTGKQTIKVWTK
ncbi:right-handed parallel beta-helix repeat-containing protein [Pinibacter aurantiacus]|uniref:Right-handed parallel beta-helix repeat-containing protein n=1 Tax=Pinibacter aurantiacus TaxID=2851599 RepID=A0A9E2SDZ5_9BACT|nr:right-handed parallel beta-helix repeat-containing protein [Pinibacter aurantiacus]MBV4358225.1 right-handed parallel beta-helix repeat-containing protein [Pinibacter aurantiacus]